MTVAPGFDPAHPATWHPMNGSIVGALQSVAPTLGIPLGTNLAPAAEIIARSLCRDELLAEVERLRIERDAAVLAARDLGAEIERLRTKGEPRHAAMTPHIRAVAFNAIAPVVDQHNAAAPNWPDLFLPLSLREAISVAVARAVLAEQSGGGAP